VPCDRLSRKKASRLDDDQLPAQRDRTEGGLG
jgi:hypothetical protein